MGKAVQRNRPLIGMAAVAFASELLSWGMNALPDSVPTGVTSTGYTLALVLIVGVAGYLVQQVGEHAPWANDTVEEYLVEVAEGDDSQP